MRSVGWKILSFKRIDFWTLLFVSCMSLLSINCGLRQDIINVDYKPNHNSIKLNGASVSNVDVFVSDSRLNKQEVGKKGNEYSFLGSIVAQNDIGKTIHDAIEAELKIRGFILNKNGAKIYVDLNKFYNEFKGFNEKSIAECIISVQVKDKGENIVYSKTFIGEGVNPDVYIRSGENAKISLDAALKNTITKIFEDMMFIEALMKHGV